MLLSNVSRAAFLLSSSGQKALPLSNRKAWKSQREGGLFEQVSTDSCKQGGCLYIVKKAPGKQPEGEPRSAE